MKNNRDSDTWLEANFDLTDSGFQSWLERNSLELSLTRQDNKLVRRYLKHIEKQVENWKKVKGNN